MNRIAKHELDALIRGRQFAELFIRCGWDREGVSAAPLPLTLAPTADRGGDSLVAEVVAEKRGFAVCVCDAGDAYPHTRAARRRLVTQLSRHHYEHLLIICGAGKQCWSAAIRPHNRPMRNLEVEWSEGQDTQSLKEKLDGIIFDISDEEKLGITDVVEQVRSAFMENADQVTRKFYREFQTELAAFAEFIGGIDAQITREWYAALMLNRLMFIYFIQKKGFLDDDPNYLENRLRQTQAQFGKDRFEEKFYRHFLRRLFAEGLGTPLEDRAPELRALIGKVPYLNGGLFDIHEIEKDHQSIAIPDAAFENLFAFFSKYHWHLDTRSTASGHDINPDVIGYIFEKYINDRAAMGAYYTQEDITGYIARNTIIPFLLRRAEEKCANAFDAQTGIWRLLRENPDAYIYPAVQKGGDIPDQEIPERIRRGLDAESPGLLARRKHWNEKADQRFALPLETWREAVARRGRYFELKAKMRRGDVHRIDDLITHNLDIERFAADALRDYEGSDFIAAFFAAIAGRKAARSDRKDRRGVTVLDPACGSGAFLFAALNVLEPLYEKCIERMREFVEADDAARRQKHRKGGKRFDAFREVLNDIDAHPNPKYWIYKTVILNNLYGVDLMREAAEIAKLRLFLKLAAEAQYDPAAANLGLEPLPDIDFNIRAGNSLVGFASMAEFEAIAGGELVERRLMAEIREDAKTARMADDAFRKAQNYQDQSGKGGEDYRRAKHELAHRLDALNQNMNRYLAKQYGIDDAKPQEYAKWRQTHRPFHWLAEFYGIIEEDGGFDVVVGNPPYVEYSKVKKQYEVKEYKTESCGNLYAFFIERAVSLVGKNGLNGMIVPVSLPSTPRMKTVRELLRANFSSVYVSNFADRPATLFNGVHQKLSIYLASGGADSPNLYSTNFLHWNAEARDGLLRTISYIQSIDGHTPDWNKKGRDIENSIMAKISNSKFGILSALSRKQISTEAPLYLNMRLMYWVKCFLAHKKSSEFKTYYPGKGFSNTVLMAILNSNSFFWFWETTSDCWHLTNRELAHFFINERALSVADKAKLDDIGKRLEQDLEKNKRYVGTVQTDYEYYHRKSKPIIDEIDSVIARHCKFTDEELDYIINYDIKYRMGRAGDG